MGDSSGGDGEEPIRVAGPRWRPKARGGKSNPKLHHLRKGRVKGPVGAEPLWEHGRQLERI